MNELNVGKNMFILSGSKMKKVIALCVIAITPILSFAGLVEVASSQFIRDSGSPKTESSQIELKNAGEIRISNAGLESSQIEIASSTEITLNGQNLLRPFSLPPGGSVVFDLDVGTYEVAVTLRGKPGGGVKVRFFEKREQSNIKSNAWRVLDDGTLLHEKTGLNWHRMPGTPGKGAAAELYTWVFEPQKYISDLNAGKFGSSPETGNAGYGNWRIPTANELITVMDYRFGDSCWNRDERLSGFCANAYRLTDSTGENPFTTYGDPFFLDNFAQEPWRPEYACDQYLSSTISASDAVDDPSVHEAILIRGGRRSVWPDVKGCVWPVRDRK